ncbi:response regulator [Stappia sp. WLB 29]|uniref:response regulator n=1 Tax=Stappia sp. WLB 29 TaxID=2925220 RepID=UPI0020C055F4|nr:response regulator [Stappia sp. WLB 29]
MNAQPASASGPGLTLMIVDDDPDDLWMFGHLFRRACPEPGELSLVAVADGAAALARIEQALSAGEPLPDAILLDMNMPGLSGLDVLAALRARAGLDATPIIILSTAEDAVVAERALAAGADAVFTKPDSMDSIACLAAGIFRTVLARRAPRPCCTKARA